MRPLRFVLLVACFIAIPIFLTCISLLRGQRDGADVFGHPPRSRVRALFSFSTPSALFPPSAIISLASDNSTVFLARPAAFGPSLPSKGLTGQLWIGRGFGDDTLLSEDDLKISGFELGCSDVPGWGDEQRNTPDNPALNERSFKKAGDDSAAVNRPDSQISSDFNKAEGLTSDGTPIPDEEDGTDDHLHRPLQDSNPAPVVKPGEPANANTQDKPQKPTHADIESLQESADIAGKIVMLSRGGCGFLEKVKWAQRRGGIALIVGDNQRSGQLTIMYAKGDTSNVTIPAIFTSYTSAHLLSTLVPPDLAVSSATDGKKAATGKGSGPDTNKGKIAGSKNNGPVFTTSPTTSPSVQPTKAGSSKVGQQAEQGWMQNVLQAVGFDEAGLHAEDSRRPPGSGNIEWVQVKDWDDDVDKPTSTGTLTSTASKLSTSTTKFVKHQTTSRAGDDDFVIGVQDWRDTELIAPKSTSTASSQKGKSDKKDEATNTATSVAGKETQLKGGSIIPGSGEYQKLDKNDRVHKPDSLKEHSRHKDCGSVIKKIKSWFDQCSEQEIPHAHTAAGEKKKEPQPPEKHHDDEPKEGLWVTLTPTSVSASPFFDTLLVLVVSPLITLTFVYGLLLLRSRIRRRRWRAPKSVVDRLPVRVYHPMSTSSSTTSSQVPTPDRSAAGTPQLRPEPVRARQRSQTTIGVLSPATASSQSPPPEKTKKQQPKRYRGRQIECVVCLEEYVDGQSLVMSLPCGHEFHAECITPWLVNRRRTCPICKGDVVRSLQKAGSSTEEDSSEGGDDAADGIREQAGNTVPDDMSTASIPIPDRADLPNIMDEDIERGEEDVPPTEQDAQRPVASRWRGIVNSSLSNLSGDTLWRTNSVERNR